MVVTECRYILKGEAGVLRTVVRTGDTKLVLYATGSEPRDLIKETERRADSWVARGEGLVEGEYRPAAMRFTVVSAPQS